MISIREIIFGAIISLIFLIDSLWKLHKKTNHLKNKYSSFSPVYLLVWLAVGWCSCSSVSEMIHNWIPTCLTLFVTMMIYDLLLFMILPFLRKHFSSAFCYLVWGLPNALYLHLLDGGNIINSPVYVFTVPRRFMWVFLIVWLLGFVGIMFHAIFTHMRFCLWLWEDVEKIEDEGILSCWNSCRKKFGDSPKEIPLYYSDKIQTPLSISFFIKGVFLPKREYTGEELTWIFCHEIYHIEHMDSYLKIFITFWKAVFWFLPPIWTLSEKVSEDIELNCDEQVLAGESEENRLFYANLILKTGGDSRAFTTCLSATGESIRYRMKRVIHPKNRNQILENILAAAIIFLLFVTFGLVQISFG